MVRQSSPGESGDEPNTDLLFGLLQATGIPWRVIPNGHLLGIRVERPGEAGAARCEAVAESVDGRFVALKNNALVIRNLPPPLGGTEHREMSSLAIVTRKAYEDMVRNHTGKIDSALAEMEGEKKAANTVQKNIWPFFVTIAALLGAAGYAVQNELGAAKEKSSAVKTLPTDTVRETTISGERVLLVYRDITPEQFAEAGLSIENGILRSANDPHRKVHSLRHRHGTAAVIVQGHRDGIIVSVIGKVQSHDPHGQSNHVADYVIGQDKRVILAGRPSEILPPYSGE